MAILVEDGDRIDFDKRKVTHKDGSTSTISGSGSKSRITKDKKKSSSSSGSSSSDNKTRVSVVSDSEEDRGKTFGGTPIQTPEQYERSRNKTRVNVVSDSKEDRGKTFGGTPIQTPREYEESRQIRGGQTRSTDEVIQRQVRERYLNIQRQRKLNEQNNKKSVDNNTSPNSGDINSRDNINNITAANTKFNNSNIEVLDNRNNVLAYNTANNLSPNQTLQQQRTVTDKERLITEELSAPNPLLLKAEQGWDKGVDSLQFARNWAFGGLKKGADFLSNKSAEINKKTENKRTPTEPAQAALYGMGSSILNIGVVANEQILDPVNNFIRDPVKTVKNIATSTAVTFAYATSEPGNFASDVQNSVVEYGQKLQSGDPRAVAQIPVTIGSAAVVEPAVANAVLTTTAKTIRVVREATVRATKPEIDADAIFNKQSLDGENFPRAASTQETIDKLAAADNQVVTISDRKLGRVDPDTLAPTSNPITGQRMAGETRKGSLGMEDGGINVAPLGEANKYFTRDFESAGTKTTYNPITIAKSFVDKLNQQPTATKFNTQGVELIPDEVLQNPGFEAVKEFQEEVAGSGKVLPTKRGMIGQGEVKPQYYIDPVTGKRVLERGTSEIELTIPRTQQITNQKVVGYTKINGKTIIVREGDLITDNLNVVPKRADNTNIQKLQNKFQKARENLSKPDSSSSYNPNINYKVGPNPIPSFSNIESVSSRVQRAANSGGGGSGKGRNMPSSGIPRGDSLGFPSSIPIRPSSPFPGSSGFPSSVSSSSDGGGSSGGSGPGGGSGSSGGSSVGGGRPTQLTPNARLPSSDGFKPKKRPAYDVYIRENGKRIKANKKPIPYNQAIKRGSNIIDNTIAASFDIVKRGTTSSPDIPGQNLSNKFRKRKTKNALRIVEKSKYRIDTSGEKKGLKSAKFIERLRL